MARQRFSETPQSITSIDHGLDHFKRNFGPTRVLFERLPPSMTADLEAAVIEMWARRHGLLAVPVEYVQVIAVKT